MLTLALILAFADRGLLSILVDPVKKDLHLTDLQMSYMLGFAFSAVYSIAALPLGYLVDRVNRRSLIAVCIVTWSIMTGYACFAESFGQLFVARMGLGIAEAALAPAAFSMIRDSFSLTQRARAFAVLNSAHLVGGGSALLVGGALLGFASNGGLHSLSLSSAFTSLAVRLDCSRCGRLAIRIGIFCIGARTAATSVSARCIASDLRRRRALYQNEEGDFDTSLAGLRHVYPGAGRSDCLGAHGSASRVGHTDSGGG